MELDVVVDAYNPSNLEAQIWGIWGLRPALETQQIQGHPGLYKILSKEENWPAVYDSAGEDVWSTKLIYEPNSC